MSNRLGIEPQRPQTPMVALAIIIALSATATSAQTVTPAEPISAEDITPEMRAAFEEARPYCEADAVKFCSLVVPGGGRIVQCMLQHVDELSPSCKQKIREVIPQ